jgi:hypothetical protein
MTKSTQDSVSYLARRQIYHFIKNMHTVLVRIQIYDVCSIPFRVYSENLDILFRSKCWGAKASEASSSVCISTSGYHKRHTPSQILVVYFATGIRTDRNKPK